MENNPQRSKTSGGLLAALIIMTGLAGVSSYLYFDQKKVSENQEVTISERVEELSTTRVKLDSISTALDAKIAEVQKLGGDVTELQKVKEQLEQDKAALRKGNRVSIAKYETKIKQYEAFLAEKDTLISNLQRENVTLATNVKTLDEENTGLKVRGQQFRDSITTVVTDVQSKNEDLSNKVTRAAALKAQNVKVFAVNSKGKVKEDDSYKAKRLDKIKLVYTLLDNPLTKEEAKEVYVRVLDPTGAVVSDMANGSGTFSVDGNETIYTTKQTVNYTNSNQNVELLYTRGIPYKPGKYTIELYSEGFRIGSGEFAVR
jgi:outer membrane murein-binding lipoprotein Lpp/regulator of replication initiation timing